VVVFSRESNEDSWYNTEGGQNVKFNEQNKIIKTLLREHQDLRLDGFYSSLVPAKMQTVWDDYQQIFVDFGVNSEFKIKNRVLFVNALCNQDLVQNSYSVDNYKF
jgi:hypothetical protein